MALLTRKACHGFQASGSALLLPRPGWRCRRGSKPTFHPWAGKCEFLTPVPQFPPCGRGRRHLPRPALGEGMRTAQFGEPGSDC